MRTPFRRTDRRIGCAPCLRNRPYGDCWADESRPVNRLRSGVQHWPAPPTLGPVTVHRLLTALFAAPEEDEQPPPRRSQHDWIVDCMLFLLATAAGALALADQVGRGL